MSKQVKTSFKSNNYISIERPLELVHIDLFGPTRNKILNGNKYVFVIIDNFITHGFVFEIKRLNYL